MKNESIKNILINAKNLSKSKTEDELFEIIGLQMKIHNIKSKVELALFIMKDNEWYNDEGSIEHQVYKILEKAIEEL